MKIRKATIKRKTSETDIAIDHSESPVRTTIRAGAQTIYVNLSQATFLCSAGLRVLLQYWRQMKNSQKVLLVTRPSPETEEVIAGSGFKGMLVEPV